METIYLVCLIFGGFFLAVSIFAGTEADADFALTADVDMDLDVDTEIPGEGMTSAIQFLSFRNLIFFFAFFGLSGSLLSRMAAPAMVTFAAATGLGVLAATLGHKAMQYLKQTESGASMDLRDLEGLPAKVTVDVSKAQKGKVSVRAKDRIFQILAMVAEEAEGEKFRFGDAVTIIRIEGNTAYIAEADFISR